MPSTPPRTTKEFVASLPIRSDDLAPLRDVLAAFPLLTQHVGTPEEARFVIDANAVIGDIRWLVKKRRTPGARTALQEAIASGTIVAFAPSFLDDEVRLNLAELSLNESVPLEPMLAAWEEYRACIRFYEARRPVVGEAAPGVADPKDVPYVEAYLAVGAAAILTNDPHLERMKARTVRLELAVSMRDYARAASVELTLKWNGVLLLTLGIGLAQQFAQVVTVAVRAIRRAPKGIQVALGAALVVALLHRPTRDRVVRALTTGWEGVLAVGKQVAPLLAEMLLEAEQSGKRARSAWAAVAAEVKPPRVPLRAHVLGICVASGRPLSADEVTRELTRLGVRTTAASFRPYLRRVLRRHPGLVRVGQDQWAAVGVPGLGSA